MASKSRKIARLINDAWSGHIDEVRQAIHEGIAVDTRGPDDDIALSAACVQGHVQIAQELITAGADINAGNSDDNFPLMAALGHSSALDLLLRLGADVNRRYYPPGIDDRRGSSTLILAAKIDENGKSVADVRRLAEFGADLNARSADGASALIWAIRGRRNFNRIPIVETLIELGADLNIRDGRGYTPLMYAVDEHLSSGDTFRASRHDTSEVIDLLRNASANEAGVRDVEFAYVVASGDRPKVLSMVAEGVNMDLPAPTGTICLARAVRLENHEMVDTLLEAGADINATPPEDDVETPLIAAVKNDDFVMVRKLIEAGANLGAEGPFGTAIDYAGPGDPKVLKYLKEQGARTALLAQRGLAADDKDQSLLLVHADVATVTDAVEALAKDSEVFEDVQGLIVHPTDECYVVYQLDSHEWTCVYPARAQRGESRFGPTMAKDLSKAISTKVVFYGNDDNMVYCGYELFQDGKSVEYVYMGPKGCEAAFQWRPGPDDPNEDDEDVVLVRSKRRKLKQSDVEFEADFIHDFFVAENAYVPSWGDRELRITGKSKRYFSRTVRDVFVRVDFITFGES